jgi:hypothetical protein
MSEGWLKHVIALAADHVPADSATVAVAVRIRIDQEP